VGDLFAGAIVPGMMLVGLYLLWVLGQAVFNPRACPSAQDHATATDVPLAVISPGRLAFALIGPLALVVAVLGSILGGIATPTEAASVGVAGALFLAGLRVSLERNDRLGLAAVGVGLAGLTSACALAGSGLATALGWGGATGLACAVALGGLGVASWVLWREGALRTGLKSTAEITAMVFLILIAAQLFSIVFRELGGDAYIACLLGQIPGGLVGAMLAVMAVMFVLGFFLDFIEITSVVVPIVAPALILMGADPIWLGVMMAVNLQTSFLTPPFGFALFYLRGAAPPSVSTLDIWRGAIPFVALQVLALILIALFPALATWLPSLGVAS
jgi:TRAP-type mannitol/chloroaromatic compound transport system permease large subunit